VAWQPLNATRGGVDALKQGIEREFTALLDNQLSIENEAALGVLLPARLPGNSARDPALTLRSS
jgi:hypothetical protein